MIPLYHRDTRNRADPYSEPNSWFSDISEFLEFNKSSVPFRAERSVNSMNSENRTEKSLNHELGSV